MISMASLKTAVTPLVTHWRYCSPAQSPQYRSLIMFLWYTPVFVIFACFSLQWRHNEHNNIKAPRHWPLCGNSPRAGEFPAQMASNAESVSIWWRHHVLPTKEFFWLRILSALHSWRSHYNIWRHMSVMTNQITSNLFRLTTTKTNKHESSTLLSH